MKHLIMLAAMFATAASPVHLVSASENAPEGGQLFIVHFSTGPAWQQDLPFSQQEHAREHSSNLQRLRASGALLIGGRYSDKGFIVIRSASEAAARNEIDQDPAVTSGVFDYELATLSPFYEGCITREAQGTPAQ